jgi:hypothetical protein
MAVVCGYRCWTGCHSGLGDGPQSAQQIMLKTFCCLHRDGTFIASHEDRHLNSESDSDSHQ